MKQDRLKIVAIFFCILFIFIILKLFNIQVLDSSAFSADYTRTQQLTPERGQILDTNLHPFSLNKTTYALYIEPQNIKSKAETVDYLHDTLDIEEASLEAKIDLSKQWVRIEGSLPTEVKNTIEKSDEPGLKFIKESERYYPEASLAAHLIGFVGKNSEGESIGYFGLEGYYDKDLTGLPGVLQSERDLAGNTIFLGNQKKLDAANGRNLVLTVDKSVQLIIKKKLQEGIETYKAESGCAIVADPQTMAILGMVCMPDFDPTTYYDFSEQFFKNWSISSVYEPGSTFKPLVMAAAIEEGKVKKSDTYDEESPVTIGKYTVRNWDNKYNGKLTMTNIIEKSSNVGMVYVGSKLGKENLYTYLTEKYKFDQPTGVDLQGEVGGSIKPLDSWYPIDEATMAFGQGLSVNMVQMVRAFSSIINGGHLMKPYVVKGVLNNDGSLLERSSVEQGRTISEKASKTIREMLASAVAHAEAPWDIPEGYSFGGKTGTAQIAVGGSYDASKTIASYVGFTPVSSPKLIAMVVLVKPQKSPWGSETAAPIYYDIMRELLIYYNIPRE
ncbi:penicillin-binding protein 2 [Candidatus Woesebacteria bacterium]|nr:penicillin-binding protein 2 [Candidatus Woesebacteria bacterium]